MSDWADTTRCEHGMTFNQECDYCEIVGLKDSLKWMSRAVKKNKKRLQFLLDKVDPLTNHKEGNEK